MKRLLVLLFVLSFITIGCDDDGGGGGAMTLDEFSSSYATLTCEKYMGCCEDHGGWEWHDYATVDECIAGQTEGFKNEIDPSRVQVNEGGLRDLYNYMANSLSVACDEEPSGDEVELERLVGLAFEGLQAVGDPCDGSMECASGLYCDYDDPSVCAERDAEGDDCDWDTCVIGLICSDETQTCEQPQSVGDDCLTGEYDDYCEGMDLYCDSETLKCAAKKANGESCSDYMECLSWECNSDNICESDGDGDTILEDQCSDYF